jgi:hypothetical protein
VVTKIKQWLDCLIKKEKMLRTSWVEFKKKKNRKEEIFPLRAILREHLCEMQPGFHHATLVFSAVLRVSQQD